MEQAGSEEPCVEIGFSEREHGTGVCSGSASSSSAFDEPFQNMGDAAAWSLPDIQAV